MFTNIAAILCVIFLSVITGVSAHNSIPSPHGYFVGILSLLLALIAIGLSAKLAKELHNFDIKVTLNIKCFGWYVTFVVLLLIATSIMKIPNDLELWRRIIGFVFFLIAFKAFGKMMKS